MIIELTESFDTIGWSDAQSQAPAQAISVAKNLSNQGQPNAIAKLVKRKPEDNDVWVVLGYRPETYIAWRQNDETKSS